MKLAAASFLVGAVWMAACGSDHEASPRAPNADSAASAVSTARASATPSPAAAPAIASAAPFTCLSWAHLASSSTDCYRTRAECDAAREGMVRGARHPTACRDAAAASCTMLSDATDPAKPPSEHCFGHAGNCGRYRAFIAGGIAKDSLRTSDCAAR